MFWSKNCPKAGILRGVRFHTKNKSAGNKKGVPLGSMNITKWPQKILKLVYKLNLFCFRDACHNYCSEVKEI